MDVNACLPPVAGRIHLPCRFGSLVRWLGLTLAISFGAVPLGNLQAQNKRVDFAQEIQPVLDWMKTKGYLTADVKPADLLP